MSVELGGRNINRRNLKMGSWGEYSDPKGKK